MIERRKRFLPAIEQIVLSNLELNFLGLVIERGQANPRNRKYCRLIGSLDYLGYNSGEMQH